jgi:polyhydroxyalkanoate synthase
MKKTVESVREKGKLWENKVQKALSLLIEPPKVDVGTTPSKVVYSDGKMRLLHYAPMVSKPHRTPLLVIYALLNKPYILDLQPDRSVVRTLLKEGFDVYLIDWGEPTDADKFHTLDDYVNWYIDDVVDFICDVHKVDDLSILGYCMGGTLSTMYAALHPRKVRNLVLMAAPLDFEADQGLLKQWARSEFFNVDSLVDTIGNVPGEFLNSGFLLMDPVKNLTLKYLGLIENIEDEEFVKLFFRMEKWIYDGIPVAGEAYREYMKQCYQQNLLVKSELKLNGHRVDLKNITMPVLNLVATYDHLVPPESGMTFTHRLPSRDKKLMTFPTGHIGLSVSSKSHAEFWPGVSSWLRKRSDGEKARSKGKSADRRQRKSQRGTKSKPVRKGKPKGSGKKTRTSARKARSKKSGRG